MLHKGAGYMTQDLNQKISELLVGKIKEPISEELILAGEHHVRAKLSVQNRSYDQLDNSYLAELIAESTLQIVASESSAMLIESLSIIS